ncbi:MAG TPA: cyclase family protein [Alphaproteobacteria bacterium]|jgi:kynurenine formamidase|nr:cyclase family protein [Alphaproteobacteria bacterium]
MNDEQTNDFPAKTCCHGHDAKPGDAPRSPERRGFLKAASLGVGALGAAAAVPHELALVAEAQGAQLAQAQTPAGETPIGAKWWPSRWGPDDQAGASNLMTPERVLAAARLIKTGKVYEIGRVYESGMPLFGERVFALRIPGAPTGGVFGKNQIVWHDEYLSTEIGQVGTQFDGLAHIGVAIKGAGNHDEMRFYNGFAETDIAGPYGMKKLGIENVKPIFTRGVLLDIQGLRGRMLNGGEEVGVADLTGALQRQGLPASAIGEGDAVFIHTGWGALWMKDNAKYNSGEPGIGLAAARWLAERRVVVVGADTWGVEAVPNPDPDLAFPAHQELITRNGIFLHENLDLGGLAADRVNEFVYVMTPLRIKGATGSPGRPIAIV